MSISAAVQAGGTYIYTVHKNSFSTLITDVARVACESQLSHNATALQAQSYIGWIFCPALLATPKGFGLCNTSLMYTLWCNCATCNDKSSCSDVCFHQINPRYLSGPSIVCKICTDKNIHDIYLAIHVQIYTVKNEEFLELLELAIYSLVIVTNSCGEFK